MAALNSPMLRSTSESVFFTPSPRRRAAVLLSCHNKNDSPQVILRDNDDAAERRRKRLSRATVNTLSPATPRTASRLDSERLDLALLVTPTKCCVCSANLIFDVGRWNVSFYARYAKCIIIVTLIGPVSNLSLYPRVPRSGDSIALANKVVIEIDIQFEADFKIFAVFK